MSSSPYPYPVLSLDTPPAFLHTHAHSSSRGYQHAPPPPLHTTTTTLQASFIPPARTVVVRSSVSSTERPGLRRAVKQQLTISSSDRRQARHVCIQRQRLLTPSALLALESKSSCLPVAWDRQPHGEGEGSRGSCWRTTVIDDTIIHACA
jgi:hypothetical protein